MHGVIDCAHCACTVWCHAVLLFTMRACTVYPLKPQLIYVPAHGPNLWSGLD